MNFKYKLLLASQSPRRRELLGNLGFEVEIIDQFSDEIYPSDLPNDQIAAFLANKKSDSIKRVLNDNEILVCADTIVVLDGKVYEKPKDAKDAIQMLNALSDKTHIVYTGVCLRSLNAKELFTAQTEVTFLKLTASEIEFYVENFKPFDKAGGYGIQDWMGYIGVQSIQGCYYNVMGLPLSLLNRKLMLFNV